MQKQGRMWGHETVAGTRIPVFRLVELATDGGYTAESISKEIYPALTAETIGDVLRTFGITSELTSCQSSVEIADTAVTGVT